MPAAIPASVRSLFLCLSVLVALSAPCPAPAFQKDGCGAGGSCSDCHTLTREEAAGILTGVVDNVLNVEMSPVRGLWVVDISKDGRSWPVYIDFSKDFLINGQVIRLSTKESVTDTRSIELNRVDVSSIPLAGAIVIGNPKAKRKVIVFSDPDCHYCAKLHDESKKVVERSPDTAFHVKLYSRNNNPASVRKALSVVCGKSEKLLEDAYAGREVPPPDCKTTSVSETAILAQKLRIQGTPAMVLPDGRVIPGFRTSDAILKLLDEAGTTAGGKGKSGKRNPPGTEAGSGR